MDNDQAFDEWFEKWFSDDLIVALRELRDDVKGIRNRIERMEEVCPALKGWLDEEALAKEIEKERLRPPLELVRMLKELRASLGVSEQQMQLLLELQTKIERLPHQLLDMLVKTGRLH